LTTWRWLALAVSGTFVLAGCGGDGDSDVKSDDASKAKPAGRVIEVRMLPERRFEPSTVTAKAGETVTFKVTNGGDTFHEFTVGDEATQAAREKLMAGMGPEPMRMDDEANTLNLAKGDTEELTWTFDKAGTVLYGCHQPGHYSGGMKGTVTVT